MNCVPFSKGLNQSSPPFNLIGRKALNEPLQYIREIKERKLGLSTIREKRYMKFRRWQSQEYFVQIAEEVMRLGGKTFSEQSKQLQGGVSVEGRWAIYNWVIEFENLMHWARADQNYLSNSTHSQSNTLQKSRNLLQLPQVYIDKLDSIKSNISSQKLNINKCLKYLLGQLSTVQFYALQFMVKLLKINEFFKNMKAFSEAVGKVEREFCCFGGYGGVNDNGDDRSRVRNNYPNLNLDTKSKSSNTFNNSKSSPSPPSLTLTIDHYGQIFYLKNEPQLNLIKSEIQSILQSYQMSLLMSQTNTQWYQIQICIKLLRQQIYKQSILLQEKQQQFQFLIINSGVDQTLGKIAGMRTKASNNISKNKNTFMLRRYNSTNIIKVSQLIKEFDHILDTATQIVQQESIYKQREQQHKKMKITKCLDQINSQNSNSIIQQQEEEQKTKKILPLTDVKINVLGFSKSLSVSNNSNNNSSNSNSLINENNNKNNNDDNCTMMMIMENNNNNNNKNINQQKHQHQKNLLQMLQDEKTIRENFSLLSVNEIKKQKKIKKMSRKRQLYKFQCVNGKIVLAEQKVDKQKRKYNCYQTTLKEDINRNNQNVQQNNQNVQQNNQNVQQNNKNVQQNNQNVQQNNQSYINDNNINNNNAHYIRNKYKQKRLQQLLQKRKEYNNNKQQQTTKYDSIQQEHKNQQQNQQNQQNQSNININIVNRLSPQLRNINIDKNNQQLHYNDYNDENNISPQQQQHQQQKQQSQQQQNNIFMTPIKDKPILQFVKMPIIINFNQQQQRQQQQDHQNQQHHQDQNRYHHHDNLNFNNININYNNINNKKLNHHQQQHNNPLKHNSPVNNNKISTKNIYNNNNNIHEENYFYNNNHNNKKDENHSNIKSISNDKTLNFKQSYKLANNRFAPLSRTNTSINRFNPKMSFIRKNKNISSSSRHLRPSLQPSALQMTYFKKLHQPRFDAKYINSYEDDQYLVDDTPPKYKKATKVAHQ